MDKPRYLELIEMSGATFIAKEPGVNGAKAYWVEYGGDVYRWSLSSVYRNSLPWIDSLSKFPKGFHIYKMYSGNETLYIGKTKNLTERLHAHFVKTREDWKNTVDNIEISRFENESDMHILEMYLITKYKPSHNRDAVCADKPTFELPEPIFEPILGWETYD